MGHHPSILADREFPVAVRPAAGRTALLAILTDPAVLRIALLAAGVCTLLVALAAVV